MMMRDGRTGSSGSSSAVINPRESERQDYSTATELAKPKQAQFGMIGLGVMGRNLALNVEEKGFPVAVWNLETEWVEKFVQENNDKQITGTVTLEDFVSSVERPRRIMMMIKA